MSEGHRLVAITEVRLLVTKLLEAEDLCKLTEWVPNGRPNFGWMLYARMKQRLILMSALSGQEML